MAYMIDLKTFTDKRGNLTVIEKTIPFDIKRIFYIYGVDESVRGGHRHKTRCRQRSASMAPVIFITMMAQKKVLILLDQPNKCLILEPEDWHIMDQFTPDAILMVLASTTFDQNDYIFEPYSK